MARTLNKQINGIVGILNLNKEERILRFKDDCTCILYLKMSHSMVGVAKATVLVLHRL